ncbi:MAG: Type 1 glutamine amidotransferase-like domain-containing protein [Chloroflexota bacterium]
MKLLLVSSGITNASIRNALIELLGKPIEESSAQFIATGMHPFAGGPGGIHRAIAGDARGKLYDLGWKSIGLLELTALPSIDRATWETGVRETDALLVWGGDPVYLAHWLRKSGVADLLPSLENIVYVGVSAGAIATAETFTETYSDPPKRDGAVLKSEKIKWAGQDGDEDVDLVTAPGIGLVDFAVIPHYVNPNHGEVTPTNAERWAAHNPGQTYAIDEATGLKIVDGTVEVVSEGVWKLFET